MSGYHLERIQESDLLAAIVSMSKQVLMESGCLPPTLFPVGSDSYIALGFERLSDDSQIKRRQFFEAGRHLAKKGTIGNRLESVVYAFEAWMTTSDRKQPLIRPSLDPARREMLMIVQSIPETQEYRVAMFEQRRNKIGKVISLTRVDDGPGPTEATFPLLDAFVAGFASCKKSLLN